MIRGDLILIPIGAVVTAAVTVAAVANLSAAMMLAAALIPLALLFAARKRLNPIGLSLIWLVTLVVLSIGIFGYFLEEALRTVPGGESIKFKLDEPIRQQTTLVFVAAATSLVIGGLLASLGRKKVELPELSISSRGDSRKWLLVGALVPLAFMVINDAGALIYRTEYLSQSAGGLGGFAAQVALGAMIVLGHVFALERGGLKFAAFLGLLGYLALFFALASRSFSLALILFALGYLSGNQNRKGYIAVAIAGAWTVVSLQIPLYLRGQMTHGLFPYLEYLPGLLDRDIAFLEPVKNVMISYNITATTAYGSPSIPIGNIFTAINPVTGDSAGWYSIASQQRINQFVPYSGIGELANVGILAVVGFFLAAGLVLGVLERRVQTLFVEGKQIYALLLVGLALLFALLCIQYNLRSASRMLYYMILLDLAVIFIYRVRAGLERRNAPTPTALLLSRPESGAVTPANQRAN